MKKILVRSIVAMSAILFLTQAVNAHGSYLPVPTVNDSPTSKKAVTGSSKAGIKAANDLKVRFNEPADVKWFSDKNGLMSYFKKDGFTGRVYYDLKGHCRYSILYYTESRLPKNVRTAVKSVYYDMSIIAVEEVQTADAKVYIVHLEDSDSIKILKVNDDGDMATMQEIMK